MDNSHRNLLREKRMDLVRDLDVDTATSFLYSKSILSENDRDEILALKTQQAKSERLLDVLPKRGPEAFGVFVQFLDENQSYLSGILKPNSSSEERKQAVDNLDSSCPVPDKKPAVETGEDMKRKQATDTSSSMTTGTEESQEDGAGAKKPEEGSVDQGDGSRNSRLTLKPSTYKDGITPDFMYPMTNRPRGQAFIINNKTFLPSSGMEKYPRNGTDVDAEALYKLFNALEFKTEVYHNRSTNEITRIFDKYAAMDHTKHDCIICAILTHGEEGLIYSTDGQIKLKELTSKFRCPNLHGKPKLFFFQACQGFDYMEGDYIDGPGQEQAIDEVDAPGNNKITLPVEADFMYAYSTVPGYYSWRNSVRGSWFVQAIVSVFRHNAMTMDVLRMMTRVNAEVAKQKSNTNESFSDNKKQIPSIISQLRKELYFFPENVMEDVHGDITDATVHKKHGSHKKNCSIF